MKKEAAAYTLIGENRLREYIKQNKHAEYLIWTGSTVRIKRPQFERSLKDSTRTNYKYMYKRYMRNGIGLRKLSSFKYSDIKKFYNSLIRERGLKLNTLETIHTILHPIFTTAVRDGYIRSNPASGAMAEIKKSHDWEKPKRHALTAEQQTAFVEYLSTSKEYKLMTASADTQLLPQRQRQVSEKYRCLRK